MSISGLIDVGTSDTWARHQSALTTQGQSAAEPDKPVKRPPKIVAGITLPRLAFSDSMFCLLRAAQGLRLPLITATGAFWSQGITGMMEKALDADAEMLLTIDYDSLFSVSDIKVLIATMDAHPEIDAMCPLQLHRYRAALLCCPDGKPNEKVTPEYLEPETTQVKTGHFGLTLIRCAGIRRLPRPWFIATPDADGRWGEGHIDEDTHFWHLWQSAGLTLHSANRVSIGHVINVAKWPGKNLQPEFQMLDDYAAFGKPEGAM